MALTDIQIKKATVPEGKKQVKLADGHGLYVLIKANGAKYWRMKYRFNGKEKVFSIGVYPSVSLKQARTECAKGKQAIKDGLDPVAVKKEAKAAKAITFEVVASEWLEVRRKDWAKTHTATIKARLKTHIYPVIGDTPISTLTPPQMLAMLRKIEAKGILETAHRVKSICSQVFCYAVTTGRAAHNPVANFKDALKKPDKRHFPAITNPLEVRGLLLNIDSYNGSFITLHALKLSALLFQRQGEIRSMEWADVDLGAKVWRIPAERMGKTKQPHTVPLSRQAIEVLLSIKAFTGENRFVFSTHSKTGYMCENTVNMALRRMGYGDNEMCAHGFRGMASTLLNEQGWNKDIIERQLAHKETNKVRAAYNHAEYLPERVKMMQAWADYLDGLKTGTNVVTLKKRA